MACLALVLALASPARAQDQSASPSQFEPPQPMPAESPPIQLSATYLADLNADAAGGERRGGVFLGKAALIADADLGRLIGLSGVTAHASVIDIHGTGLTGHVGSLAAVSGIEAEPAIRLNQAWIEVALPAGVRLRAGKFPAAPSFATSDTAAFFVNSTFGWSASLAADLPEGGPAWPLAAPGVMLRTGSTKHIRFTMALFAGEPMGAHGGDPQRDDDHGFRAFGLHGRPLFFAEAATTLGSATFKLGGWRHWGDFARLGAAPAEASLRGNWGAYGVVDWHATHRLSLFARVTLSPADRNPAPFYFDLGATLAAPFAGRPHDSVGLAFARTSLAGDAGFASGARSERIVELSYLAALSGRLSLQPNLQLVLDPAYVRGTALVTGLRIALTL